VNQLRDFEFVARRPGLPLEPFVESVWFAQGRMAARRERIAPTGSTVAVIVLGAPILQVPRNGAGSPYLADEGWLAGPHDGPVVNQPTGDTLVVGIVSTPVGCEALFGVPPAPMRGQVVELGTTWPTMVDVRRRLLPESDLDPDGCLQVVEDGLLAGLRSDVPGWQRCAQVIGALEEDPLQRISALAAALGITHGHLDREFVRVVGLTPRALCRILRLRRVLDEFQAAFEHGVVPNWSQVAADWGWFDQSHFVRDFKRHTGVTPSAYLRAQSAARDAGQQAAGFVPDIEPDR
jgi:AraC-like DNA-binding protein